MLDSKQEESRELSVEEILLLREEGHLQADIEAFGGENRHYVLILHEIYPNGTSSNGLIEDRLICEYIGKKTGLGPPTDPNGWGVWEVQ